MSSVCAATLGQQKVHWFRSQGLDMLVLTLSFTHHVNQACAFLSLCLSFCTHTIIGIVWVRFVEWLHVQDTMLIYGLGTMISTTLQWDTGGLVFCNESGGKSYGPNEETQVRNHERGHKSSKDLVSSIEWSSDNGKEFGLPLVVGTFALPIHLSSSSHLLPTNWRSLVEVNLSILAVKFLLIQEAVWLNDGIWDGQ